MPVKKRKKRRLGSSENGCVIAAREQKDHVWCWDFVFDHTTSGSQLKWLSIVDEHTRECLALKVDRSITSEDVIDTLAELFAMRGVPKCIRSDNGPEFVAQAIRRWLAQVDVETLYITAGKSRGKTATRRVSIAGSATSSWRWRCSRACRPPKRLTRQWQRRLQPSPAAQLAGLRDPDRVRGPLYCFRSGFGYASACAPAAQRRLPNPTFIAPGTRNQS